LRQSNQIEKFVVANPAPPQHHTIDLNIKGTFFLTRAAVPHMGKGSSIIVTASQVAYAGPPSLLDYTMTKAAQVGMVRGLSNQLIGKGIRVNAVCPGPVSRQCGGGAFT
jgi:NAD(P)-dependent dehydrogenase (short-subunit alcohol dehydrogenase family)